MYARKLRQIMGSWAWLVSIPKLDEKHKVLVVQKFRIYRYHADTYQRISSIKGGLGLIKYQGPNWFMMIPFVLSKLTTIRKLAGLTE